MITLSQFGGVPANLTGNAQKTISIVNEIFAAMPNRFRFTSGYRTPAQNAAANGVPNSFHVRALAADFVPIDGRFLDADKAAISAILAKYGYELITHNAGSGLHYHIEPVSAAAANMPPVAAGVSSFAIAAGVLILVLLITE